MCLDKDRWRGGRKSGPWWRSNGEGMDGKGKVKTNIRKTDRSGGGRGRLVWYRFIAGRGLDCFQGVRVIPCRPSARCQERLALAMLREKA